MKAHDPAIKAAVMAALLSGQSIEKTAEEFNLPTGTVKTWKRQFKHKKLSVSDKNNVIVEQISERLNELNDWQVKTDNWWKGLNKDNPSGKKYIYLVREEYCGFIKIGIATNLMGRFSVIDTSCPQKIMLIGFAQMDWASTAERLLHAKYRHKRVKGEWFDLDQGEIDEILNFINANILANEYWFGYNNGA